MTDERVSLAATEGPGRMLENWPLHLQGRSVLQGQTETDP